MPKISALPVNTAPDDLDEVATNDVSAVTTKKLTLAGLVAWLQTKVGYIQTAMIAAGAVTTPKFKPTRIDWIPSTSGTVATTSTTMVDVPGASFTYTSGAVAERIFIDAACMTLIGSSAGHVTVQVNGVYPSDELAYHNSYNSWQKQSRTYWFDVPANTAITIKFQFRTENSANTYTFHLDTIYRPSIRGFAIAQ